MTRDTHNEVGRRCGRAAEVHIHEYSARSVAEWTQTADWTSPAACPNIWHTDKNSAFTSILTITVTRAQRCWTKWTRKWTSKSQHWSGWHHCHIFNVIPCKFHRDYSSSSSNMVFRKFDIDSLLWPWPLRSDQVIREISLSFVQLFCQNSPSV